MRAVRYSPRRRASIRSAGLDSSAGSFSSHQFPPLWLKAVGFGCVPLPPLYAATPEKVKEFLSRAKSSRLTDRRPMVGQARISQVRRNSSQSRVRGQLPAGRKVDLHDQAGVGVVRFDAALVEVDGATGDGQAQTDSAAGAVAVRVDAVEGVEDVREVLLGNAGAVIADPYAGAGASVFEPDLDRAALRGMADGVAHHVLDRPSHQLGIALDGHHRWLLHLQAAAGRLGLDRAILHQGGEQPGHAHWP